MDPNTIINLERIKDFNVGPGTVKLLEENRGKLLDIGLSNEFFFDMVPNAWSTKAKINKWVCIKL